MPIRRLWEPRQSMQREHAIGSGWKIKRGDLPALFIRVMYVLLDVTRRSRLARIVAQTPFTDRETGHAEMPRRPRRQGEARV